MLMPVTLEAEPWSSASCRWRTRSWRWRSSFPTAWLHCSQLRAVQQLVSTSWAPLRSSSVVAASLHMLDLFKYIVVRRVPLCRGLLVGLRVDIAVGRAGE